MPRTSNDDERLAFHREVMRRRRLRLEGMRVCPRCGRQHRCPAITQKKA